MKVPYGEGLVTHTGPESCGYTRKGMGEALTGDVRAGAQRMATDYETQIRSSRVRRGVHLKSDRSI